MKKESLEKAKISYVESLLLCERFLYLSWKTACKVTIKLNKINRKTSKLKELKFWINTHTKRYRFNNFPTYFSKNSISITVDKLAALLKRIIRTIANRVITVLELIVYIRISLPIISQLSSEIITLDSKQV
jgi:hypothetical protein